MPGPQPIRSLQAKKQDMVQREIWSAAIHLFEEHGFAAVTIEDIALRAGVSRRSFFRYFASKNDVMGSVVRTFGNAVCDALLEAPVAATDVERMRFVLLRTLKPDDTGARIIRLTERDADARMAQFFELPVLEQRVAKALAARRRKPVSLNDQILAGLLFSATAITMRTWCAHPRRAFPSIVDDVLKAVVQVCGPRT